MENNTKPLNGSVERLLESLSAGVEALQNDKEGIRPCLEMFLQERGEDSMQSVIGDMVSRLTSAEHQLTEAIILLNEALNSITVGQKFYEQCRMMEKSA